MIDVGKGGCKQLVNGSELLSCFMHTAGWMQVLHKACRRAVTNSSSHSLREVISKGQIEAQQSFV